MADGGMSADETDHARRELDQAMGAMVALRAAVDAHARAGRQSVEGDHG
jgi:hypothetical protein